MWTLIHYEEYDQMAVMQWAKISEAIWPELKLLFHIPNGGKRNVREAAMLKAAGVKAGVPDLFLPVPRGRFFGLWIELKHGANKATDLQKKWIADLKEQGYMAEVAVGSEAAIQLLKDYMEMEERRND